LYKTVNHLGKRYYAQIEQNEYDGSFRIFVGAKSRCVDMTIYKNKGHMDMAQYDKECVLGEDMERKTGTIQIIQIAMEFACRLFSTMKPTFTLDDQSFITCKGPQKLRLQMLYWAVYGKTWYEKHLGAKPYHYNTVERKATRKKYYEDVKGLHHYLESTKIPFETIAKNAPKEEVQFMKDIYDQSENLNGFIQYLYQEKDCHIFIDWISKIVKPFMVDYIDMLWEIKYDRSILNLVVKELTKRPSQSFIPKNIRGGYEPRQGKN
jgi:hypothetical protein